MIKNVVFDIGNVILNMNYEKAVENYTSNKKERKFLLENVPYSYEWKLIDTGFISIDDAISIVCDRTNHVNDKLIKDFFYCFEEYSFIDTRIVSIISKIKELGYKVYLLSNIDDYTVNFMKKSTNLFDIVDGSILSYKEHSVKPYDSIYKVLIDRYSINPSESIYIDDNKDNITAGNKLGFISLKVKKDNYESVIKALKKYIKI